MNGPPGNSDWIDNLKRLVGAPIASTLLDVIEPVAPVLAQGLWVAQPLAGLWNGGDALGELAEMLEEPGGVEQLRRRLSDDEGE